MSLPDECLCHVSAPDEFGNRDLFEDPRCPLHGVGSWRDRRLAEYYAALMIAETALEQALQQAIMPDALRAVMRSTIDTIDALPPWPGLRP